MKPMDQGGSLKGAAATRHSTFAAAMLYTEKISLLTAGTSFTMAVLYGSLLTVANVGDSKAFMDTGSEIVELSTSHRIEDNIGILCTFSLDYLSSPRGSGQHNTVHLICNVN